MVQHARHVVLAGDSIFDNDVYVLGEPGVLAQMRAVAPDGWTVDKAAVDGDCIDDVELQLVGLAGSVTDIVVSVGGNDLLGHSDRLLEVGSQEDFQRVLGAPLRQVCAAYDAMLDHLAGLPVKVTLCTVYTQIPFDIPAFQTWAKPAIELFNAHVIQQAAARGWPVVRIDQVCMDAEDYSDISPIEPSAQGGEKIVAAILAALEGRGR